MDTDTIQRIKECENILSSLKGCNSQYKNKFQGIQEILSRNATLFSEITSLSLQTSSTINDSFKLASCMRELESNLQQITRYYAEIDKSESGQENEDKVIQ